MKTITQTKLVSGGNPAAGVAIAATVITGTAAVIEAGKTFVELGKDIGEAVYTKLNPDDNLGKMVYEKKDYSPTYLNYQHPNNFHGDSFHNSFGGF